MDPCDVNPTVGPDAGIEVNHVFRRFEHGLFDPTVVVVHGHEHRGGIVVGVDDDRARVVVAEDLHATCSVRGVHLNLIGQVGAEATVVRVGFVELQLHVIVRNGIGGRVAQGFRVPVPEAALRGSAPTLDLRVGVGAVAQAHQAREAIAHLEAHEAAHVQTRHGRSGAEGFEVGPHFTRLVAAVLVAARVAHTELAVGVAAPALDDARRAAGLDDRAHVVASCVEDLRARNVGAAQVDRGQSTDGLAAVVAVAGRVGLAQLPGVVAAPAADGFVAEHRAGEPVARGDGGGVHPRGEADVDEVAPHLTGAVADGHGGPKAQLSVGVVAPARDVAGAVQDAGVVPAQRHRGHGGVRGQVDQRKAVADFVRGITEEGGVARPELTVGVVAPAAHAAVVKQRTGVVPTGLDLVHMTAGWQGPIRHLRRVFLVAVTDGPVVAPAVPQQVHPVQTQRHAFGGGSGHQVTSVLATSRDGVSGSVLREQDVGQVLAHLCDLIAHVLDVALAKLADVVGAPALGVAVRGQHASMVGPQGELRSRAPNKEAVDAPKAACAGPIGTDALNGCGDGEGAAAGGDEHRHAFTLQVCRARLNGGVADLRAGLVHSNVEETGVPTVGPGHGGEGQER